MAVYLVSEQCPVSGNIYNAGMGCFNRAAIATGPGMVVSGKSESPAPEDLAAQWDAVASLASAKQYADVTEQIGDLLAAFSKPAEPSSDAGGRFETAADVFNAMPDAFVADAAAGVDIVFQYHIAGDGGGDWNCAIKDGTCRVESGVHAKPGCTLKIDADNFLAMMNGKLPAMQAYTSGKLRIEGHIMKSQLIERLFKLNV
jgi:putative sterol carrier protein